MNKYLIGGGIVILVSLMLWGQIEHKRWVKEKTRADRLEENQRQLLASTMQERALILTLKEFLSIDTLKIDSLSKALKIRPKTITRYVEIKTEVHDTVPVPVLVKPSRDSWLIQDSAKCWNWYGQAKLTGDSLSVDRLAFNYHNKITQLFYWRREHRVLFVNFGKKRYYQKTEQDCGNSQTLNIQIEKLK